ncbi:CRISPR-associated endonuclease Cas2 [uncultured Veillonella sp.]|uniref:CRISPR-associated endonuclease Cas2 n=1 Tax=uncultured Veillonella sp. TaxID=159268 RepID=UPI0026017840|nr:CRISPR-associated endonuclease Cas2 [uncultured Veillonella sp.]
MYILITYDINTESREGKRRLRNVAKVCLNYGQRVQNSVFECSVDEGQFRLLKHKLGTIIDNDVDNLRFYRLGKNYKSSIEHMGVNRAYDVEAPLII